MLLSGCSVGSALTHLCWVNLRVFNLLLALWTSNKYLTATLSRLNISCGQKSQSYFFSHGGKQFIYNIQYCITNKLSIKLGGNNGLCCIYKTLIFCCISRKNVILRTMYNNSARFYSVRIITKCTGHRVTINLCTITPQGFIQYEPLRSVLGIEIQLYYIQ